MQVEVKVDLISNINVIEPEDYITIQEVKEGFVVINKIIKKLIKDSELCLKNQSYSTCIALAILALEEIAKANFFSEKIKDKKGIKKNEWHKLSRHGAHDFKLNYAIKLKEERYLGEQPSPDLNSLNIANEKLGLIVSKISNKSEIKQDVEVAKKMIRHFNTVKKLCFYADWNAKHRKWSYFDGRFKDKISTMLAEFLIFEAKKQILAIQLSLTIPDKPFHDYSEEEWNLARNSPISKELAKITSDWEKKSKQNFGSLYQILANFDTSPDENVPMSNTNNHVPST